MGIAVQQYRLAIGSFDGRRKGPQCSIHVPLSRKFRLFWALYLLTVAMQVETDPWVVFLITIGMDVEKNPGPLNIQRDITFCNLNIQSLLAKPRVPGTIPRFTAFKAALVGTYDIITATESWLNSEIPDSDLVLDGYTGPFRQDRPDDSSHGGS